MSGLALCGMGRAVGFVGLTLGLLLLLAVGFQASLYSALAVPAAVPAAMDQDAAPAEAMPNAAPPALGDTRWGYGLNTYCELYVEQRFGLGNQGATAYAAYLRLAALGLVHRGPPDAPDELVYFGPSPDNEGDGHVGVYDGDGRFTSITSYGLQQEPMAGWRAPYLGWVRPTDIRTDRFGNPVAPRA